MLVKNFVKRYMQRKISKCSCCITTLQDKIIKKVPNKFFKNVAKFKYLISKAVPLPSCRCQGGEEYSFYSFLTSALDGGEWSASYPGCTLHTEKNTPIGTHWIGGWAGLRAGLDTVDTTLTELPQLPNIWK
jgi:hypothetical protein